MKLLRGESAQLLKDRGIVATIGNFDGVHLGHQELLRTLKERAEQFNLPMAVILFEPQPREYFNKTSSCARLSSLREKLDNLKNCAVDVVYCLRFNRKMAEMSASTFAHDFLFTKLNVKLLLVGEDFRFGKNREGDTLLLRAVAQEYNAQVEIFENFNIHGERISSTSIRNALSVGDLTQAALGMGRPYHICGRVIHGNKRGREWGIPTANLALNRSEVALRGVFVVQVVLSSGAKLFGVANIGRRPTIDGNKLILEVHLFDFADNIYGEFIQVIFLHKIRDEVKFSSLETLIAQIHQDIQVAKEFVTNLTISQCGGSNG